MIEELDEKADSGADRLVVDQSFVDLEPVPSELSPSKGPSPYFS
jgi:hypothetical protein